jgi:methylglutaconyl-CoA hydratase
LQQGLYSSLHGDIVALDEATNKLANALNQSNPEAMAILKRMLWQDTEDWDQTVVPESSYQWQVSIKRIYQAGHSKFKKK